MPLKCYPLKFATLTKYGLKMIHLLSLQILIHGKKHAWAPAITDHGTQLQAKRPAWPTTPGQPDRPSLPRQSAQAVSPGRPLVATQTRTAGRQPRPPTQVPPILAQPQGLLRAPL